MLSNSPEIVGQHHCAGYFLLSITYIVNKGAHQRSFESIKKRLPLVSQVFHAFLMPGYSHMLCTGESPGF